MTRTLQLRWVTAACTAVLVPGVGAVQATAAAARPSTPHREVVAKKKGKKHKKKTKTTTTTATSTANAFRSTLSVNACLLDTTDLMTLSPNATITVGHFDFEQQTVGAVALPNPVPVTINENGKRVTCSAKSGSDFDIVIDVVDFPGLKGADAARRAYTTVKDAYQPAKLGAARPSGPPEDLAGLGDEAFVARRDDGNAQAFVVRQGEILVRVDASQVPSTGSATLDFDAVRAVVGKVLAKAAGEVATAGSAAGAGANPKGNSGSGEITTMGAVKGTWVIRTADLGITEGCSLIPLITQDGTVTGSINPLVSGSVTFSSQTLPQDLKGNGATVQLPSDPTGPSPKYHVDLDATVKEDFTGKSVTTIKGSFDYTCTSD